MVVGKIQKINASFLIFLLNSYQNCPKISFFGQVFLQKSLKSLF